MTEPKRFFIIDAMAMAFRSFFALGRSPLTTHDGTPISAVYASAVFMNKLLLEEKPDYLAVVRESKGPTFRTEIYSEYKATRDKMPSDLQVQLPYFWQLFEKFGCPAIQREGMEADDVIGTLATEHASENLHIYIVSGDKDFMQLISDQVFMYSPKKGEEAIIVDRQAVKDKFHCSPEQVIDCLALMGDSSDNVPGVPGIGEKGAAKLIEKYGSLAEIYQNLSEISGKRQREGLESNREQAFLSKELVTIKTDLDLKKTLTDFACNPQKFAHNSQILEFYRSLNFKQLVEKVATSLGVDSTPTNDHPDHPTKLPNQQFANIDRLSALTAKLTGLVDLPKFSFALLGHDHDIINDVPKGIAFAYGEGEAFYLPLQQEQLPKLALEQVRLAIKALLEDPNVVKISGSIKSAIHLLENLNIHLSQPFFDIGVADYLIDPNYSDHSLSSCAERILGETVAKSENWQDSCLEATTALALADTLEERMRSREIWDVFQNIDLPLVPVLARMERQGLFIAADFLASYSDILNDMAQKLENEIYQECGQEFNIGSPKQLQEILFEKLKLQEQLGIKRLKKTKTGISTDESVLRKLSAHPVPKAILKWRSVSKLKSTYVDSLPQFVNPKTNKVHTNLNQIVAATGRLSSEKPNLQNIPMRTELGQEIRKAFRPSEKNFVFVSADYSQVEIRLLAAMADAEHLINAFRNGEDIHRSTAAKIFDLDPEQVDDQSRSRAKAINFGIIYGMGPQRLAGETGVTVPEAKEFIARYFAAYPGIKRFTDKLIESARQTGFSETLTGRKRPIPGIDERNKAVLARSENIAVNAPIQGTAADLIKLAMIKIDQQLQNNKSSGRMLLQIHDELLFECPEQEAEALSKIVRQGMEHAMECIVPLTVEIGTGNNWLEAH